MQLEPADHQRVPSMFSSISKHSLRANTARRLSAASKGAIVLFAVSLAMCGSSLGAWAGVETDPNLLKLEMKFFQHEYSKEDVVARLDRIEKLVYGEVRSGDPATRLKNLVAAVPTLNDTPVQSADSSTSQAGSGNDNSSTASAPRSKRQAAPQDTDSDIASREQQIAGGSSYPQVSAMEKKLLKHDYAGDPIVKRLERLEVSQFGKVSESDDLSERVDRLKAKTGIDLAATPPPGSDWSDEDDAGPMGGGDLTYVPAQTTPFSPSRVPATNYGSGGGNYSGRGGGYGMGGGSTPSDDYSGSSGGSHGSYGYNPPRKIASNTPRTAPPGVPQPAPDIVREPQAAPAAAMGLNQRIGMLENTLFNKTFPNDTLPARLARLENTVFPGRRAAPDMSLPERVARLAEVVGPGTDVPASPPAGQRVAQRGAGNDDMMDNGGMPPVAPQRSPSAISKIINGLGNLVTGGGYGAYPMGSSNLVTDPQTGMLVDMYSGNIIDPRTGAVVGTRGMGMPTSPYGASPYGGSPYSGFNNGLSPLGSSYGGSRMGIGVGGGGMRFGSGFGMGTGFGGMGGGMGGMGMGTGLIWP